MAEKEIDNRESTISGDEGDLQPKELILDMAEKEIDNRESAISGDEGDLQPEVVQNLNEKLGEALQIIDEKFDLNYENLRKVFLQLSNTPVIIVSLVGETKIGKSFLLNNCLRHLKKIDEDMWFTDGDFTTINGFVSSSESESCSNGIWLWSEPLYADGIEYPILLMDTQGTFGDNTSFKLSTAIFAFSAIVSSITIYNVNGRVNVNDIRNLDIFAKIAEMCSGGEKPFQKFMFLCRDWKYRDYEYGFDGGYSHVNNFLEKDSEEKEAKERLLRSFGNPSGFLMPYPGEQVSEGNVTSINDFRETFREQMRIFMNGLFTEEYLQPIRLKGEVTKGEELMSYIEAIVALLNSTTEITPLSLCEVHDRLAVTDATKVYKEKINQFAEQSHQRNFLDYSIQSVFESIQSYLDNPKRFGTGINGIALTELGSKLQEINDDEKKANDAMIKVMIVDTVQSYKQSMQNSARASGDTIAKEFLKTQGSSVLSAVAHVFENDSKRFALMKDAILTLFEELVTATTEAWDIIQNDNNFKKEKAKNEFAEALTSARNDYNRSMNSLHNGYGDSFPTDSATLSKHNIVVNEISLKYEDSMKHEENNDMKKNLLQLQEQLGVEYEKFCSNMKSRRLDVEYRKSQQLEWDRRRLENKLDDKDYEISNLHSAQQRTQNDLYNQYSRISTLYSQNQTMKEKLDFQDGKISKLKDKLTNGRLKIQKLECKNESECNKKDECTQQEECTEKEKCTEEVGSNQECGNNPQK